ITSIQEQIMRGWALVIGVWLSVTFALPSFALAQSERKRGATGAGASALEGTTAPAATVGGHKPRKNAAETLRGGKATALTEGECRGLGGKVNDVLTEGE